MLSTVQLSMQKYNDRTNLELNQLKVKITNEFSLQNDYMNKDNFLPQIIRVECADKSARIPVILINGRFMVFHRILLQQFLSSSFVNLIKHSRSK